MTLAVLIFAVTYLLISARRIGWLGIDRPAGALLGAVAVVATGVLSPARALAAVDGRTLLLLFGMMGMGAFLGAEGFFDRLALALGARARTPARLLGALVWGSGLLAALITNDAVCVLAAPLVVSLVERYRLRPLPFLLALASAANTGSVATLVGNPQNMLCASLGGLAYREHLRLVGPVAVLALACNHLLLWVFFRRDLAGVLGEPAPPPQETSSPPASPPRVLTPAALRILGVLAATVVLYSAGTDLAFTAVGGCAALLLLERNRSPDAIWSRIDWSILLFFAGLFIVVEGLVHSGATRWLLARAPLWRGEGTSGWMRLSAVFLVGSNLVSNVPFILVVRDSMNRLPDPKLGWELLAVASTFAGNLTLLGSVANIIVAEKARRLGGIGFWDYLRVGLPLALLTTLLGTLWLVAFGR
jgi:Na+/H+ antiporter NhaD/arsenite permease-like protein